MKTALQVACTPTKGSKRMRHPNNSKRETSALTFHSKARLWLSSTTEISMLGRYYKSITQTFADVTFMTSTGNDNIFKWPQSDFEVVPKNRTWQIDGARWGWFWLWICAQEQDMANWRCEVGVILTLKLCPRTGHGKLTVWGGGDFDFEVVPKNRTWQIDSVRWGVLFACWNTFRKHFVDKSNQVTG